MEVFYTDRRALEDAAPEEGAIPADRLDRLGVSDGMPFILGDDGGYDSHLNRFFRALPTLGVRSPNSWRAYSLDLLTWARFLAEKRDKTVWEADRQDIAAYHAARRLSGPFAVSAATWNRGVAALDKFYRWAAAEGLIEQVPFSYTRAEARWEDSAIALPRNLAHEKAARRGDPRFLSMERYLFFRDVGLRGRLPGGGTDPTFRGRNGERNALFAETLVTTGLRLGEAASLLLPELPAPPEDPAIRSLPFDLPAPITKGQKGRRIRLPTRLLRAIRQYATIERALAVGRAGAAGRLAPPGVLAVAQADHHGGRAREGNRERRLAWDRLAPRDRRRLWRVDARGTVAEPLCVWLTEQGQPVAAPSWEAIFARASARCRRHGLDVDVTPHALRHTFAVHLLSLLIRETLAAGDRRGLESGAYRRVLGDPLNRLRLLLGHASIETTYLYLDSVDVAQETVDEAVAAWERDLAGDGG